MGNRRLIEVAVLMVLLSLPEWAACGQAANPYSEARALILATAAPEGAIGAEAGRLMDAQQYQAAMNMEFERVKKWKEVESEVWQRYLDYPSISMSLLWEAAIVRTETWACMTRSAMLHYRGLDRMAFEEDKMTALRAQEYNLIMDEVQTVAASGM